MHCRQSEVWQSPHCNSCLHENILQCHQIAMLQLTDLHYISASRRRALVAAAAGSSPMHPYQHMGRTQCATHTSPPVHTTHTEAHVLSEQAQTACIVNVAQVHCKRGATLPQNSYKKHQQRHQKACKQCTTAVMERVLTSFMSLTWSALLATKHCSSTASPAV
jgi:hypothetical protein